jgi:glycosyltransferase involved in cell wall biosynthesis
MSPLLASIVIPTFNRARRLELTLASFVHQTDQRFEVVVVDDGGTDDTPAVVAGYAGRLRLELVRLSRGGRSAARNAGVQEAKGDLLIFCDDDSIASPGFVACHLAELAAGGAPAVALGWQHGIVTVLEPKLDVPAGELLAILKRRPGLLEESRRAGGALVVPEMILSDFAATIRDFARAEPFWQEHVEPVVEAYGEDLESFAVPWAIGLTSNLSVPRRLMLDVGGFDEAFRGWGLEDTDLHLRLCAAGARTRVLRGAGNYHQVHPRPSGDRLADWIRNARYFLDKHDRFEAWAFVTGVFAELGFAKVSEIVQAYRREASSVLARELARVTREHARQLVRVPS